MDEALSQPNARFAEVQRALRQVVAEVAQIGQGRVPLAAE
jgi:N-formylglutamate deformylase